MTRTIIPPNIRKRIRKLCQSEGLSPGQLAERFSLHIDTVRGIVRDIYKKPISDRKAIENASPPFTYPKSSYGQTRSRRVQVSKKPT